MIPPDRFRLMPIRRNAEDMAQLARALSDVFEGTSDQVLVPAGPAEDLAVLRADLRSRVRRLPADVRLVVRTSGSTTGRGRLVGLAADQLRASARATDERLGGPGNWVLALPPHHIAGLQVVARSVLAGRSPVLTQGRFSTVELVHALDEASRREPTGRVYLSLVPTQLADALHDPLARAALARATSVLVGGDSTPAVLVERAHDAGVSLRRSYGMSETCGGCVYDGTPLRGVSVLLGERLGATSTSGRIWLRGPMVMSGYLDGEPGVITEEGARWIATEDWGHLQAGALVVDGRLDDVIITGGLKVSARDVRDAALASGLVSDVVVLGLPSERWGQVVTAVVVPARPWDARRAAQLRDAIGERIGRVRAPRVELAVESLPLLASGKPDRLAARRLAEQARRTGGAWTVD